MDNRISVLAGMIFFLMIFFPGKNPNFKHNERIKSETGVQRMEAARRIACLLAMHGIPGYESVRKYLETYRPGYVARWREENHEEPPAHNSGIGIRAIHILATIADRSIIPVDAVEAAAYCGGVSPAENGPRPFDKDWPYWADPGNVIYNELMQQLISIGSRSTAPMPPQRSMHGYQELMRMSRRDRSRVVRAYLAAADASERLSDHMHFHHISWHRPYEELEGGTFTSSDEVARFIDTWMMTFYEKGRVPRTQYG